MVYCNSNIYAILGVIIKLVLSKKEYLYTMNYQSAKQLFSLKTSCHRVFKLGVTHMVL